MASKGFLFASLAALTLLSAGCETLETALRVSTPRSPGKPAGPVPAKFEGLSPKQAAKKIAFVRGTIIVMQQGFKGIAGPLVEKLGFGGTAGMRTIVIKSFAPTVKADFEWRLTTTVLPNPKDLKDSGTRQTSGSLANANLLTSHKLYLPGYWIEGEQNAKEASVIWLSQEVYDDLAKNRRSTLNFGLLDLEQTGALTIAEELKKTFAQLKTSIEKIGAQKDVYFIEADPEPSTWTLKINGRDVGVEVLKARNWFGEIVVLNSKQNPLVLKVSLNPLALAAIDSATGSAFLKNALGYEITELRDIQE